MNGRRLIRIILVPILAVIVLVIGAASLFQAININLAAVIETIFGPSEVTAQLERVLLLLRFPLNLVLIVVAFLGAFIVNRLSYRLAGWLLRLANVAGSSPSTNAVDAATTADVATARSITSQQLVASLISFGAFTVASVFVLSLFISLTSLAVLATILANAFGFAARDYVGDLLNGVSNIFEDRFDIGDNVEIVRLEDDIRGIVEQINIRTLGLRTRSGELVIVPQGQVRIIRNFTRGAFTGTNVTVSVGAADLTAAMQLLVELGYHAPELLSDLIEPWRVISKEGKVNSISELVIYAKATYGRGAQLRLEIMALVQQRLAEADINLAG